MDFNVKKCKLVRITMEKQPFISNFTLKGSVLEEVNEFRDLGLLTNHHLSWNSHIDTITSKANRILGLIKRFIPVSPHDEFAPTSTELDRVRQVFTNVKIQGCVFHWSQALWRKVCNNIVS